MLDIKFIRENPDVVRAAIKNKKSEPVDLDALFKLADERKALAQKIDEINRQRNEAQKTRDIEAGKKLKTELEELEGKKVVLDKKYVATMIKLPNIPTADTPIGKDETENKVTREWGEKPEFAFVPKDHAMLGKELGIINSEKAAEVSGARFNYLIGDLVLLEWALMQFGVSVVTNEKILKSIAADTGLVVSAKPFVPVLPPVMIKKPVQVRMSRYLTDEDHYLFPNDDLMLIGSAEHTLGPLYMDEVIPEAELPIRYVGFSTAFRREAGTYGKDTSGIWRQHQFNKLEMESFCRPEDGIAEQDFLVAIQEYIMRALKLPHQRVMVCTGDMGFPDQRQIDIEVWMPSRGKYGETHSADYIGGFQARRLNTRVKRSDGSVEHVHMNDATVLSQRPLAAIMENFQQADGSIKVPDVLVPYMGKEVIRKQ